MKLAVYDAKNTDRLLGYLTDVPEIRGSSLTVSLMSNHDFVLAHLSQARGDEPVRYEKVSFEVDTRAYLEFVQIDWATDVEHMYRRKCLRTDATLEMLMKLDCFMLPGETEYGKGARLYYARFE